MVENIEKRSADSELVSLSKRDGLVHVQIRVEIPGAAKRIARDITEVVL